MKIINEKLPIEKSLEAVGAIGEGARLITALIHVGIMLKETGDLNIFGPLGLDVEMFEALFMIKGCDARPTDISRHSLMHPAKITRVLDKLEKMRAIKRVPDKEDRRSCSIRPTREGMALLDKAIAAFKSEADPIPDKIGKENFDMFMEVLMQIVRTLEASR